MAAGSSLFEEAAAGWSPTGFSNVCAQEAGGIPPEPPAGSWTQLPPELPLPRLAADPAGEALDRSLRTLAAAAACSGVKTGNIVEAREMRRQRQTATEVAGTLLQVEISADTVILCYATCD